MASRRAIAVLLAATAGCALFGKYDFDDYHPAGAEDGGVDAPGEDTGFDASDAAASDAPAIDASGCMADLMTDAHNCGACGHDCLGGACGAGVCQPWTIATGETACGYCGPSWLAVAGGYLFWTVYDPKGTVWRADLADGGVVQIAKNQNLAYPIAADSSFVYWGTSTQIVRCALAGCSGAPQPVGTQTYAGINGIAFQGSFVYWTEAGYAADAGAVWVADKTLTPTVTQIASGQYYPTGIAVADAVYWTNAGSGKADDGAMLRLTDGGTPTVLAPRQRNPQIVTEYAGHVYWTQMGTGPNYTDGAVMTTCEGDACAPTVLAPNQHEPLGIAADATGVYWAAQGDHAIYRCDPAHCTPTRVADAQAPYAVALDERSIYWTDVSPGSVVRLAKP